MPYSRITACITVEQPIQEQIIAALQELFDSFAIQHIAVFDSEISCVTVSDVENAEQVKQETKQI